MARALDVEYKQCLIAYPDDANFLWHHRVLLVTGPGLTWIWLTPTGSVQHADLTDKQVLPLRRGQRFPPQHAGNMFVFDHIPDDDMQGYLADAKELAASYGFGSRAVGVLPVGLDTWH
eukprot:10922822-Karenia_brevis.AAC.1